MADNGLEALATSVLDGDRVDWSAAESGAATASERDVVRYLKTLASLAEVHSAAGFTWGQLRLTAPIGQGAFGDVYRGWDPHLDREVAIKLLKRADDPTSTSAVVEEGRLLARVRHPNVVSIYGAERREGRTGLWMEFVKGRTLEDILAENGVFSAAEASLVGVSLCQAVSAIHAAGLLHRDIKTRNVMREVGGRIVVMDLGVGREVSANHSHSPGLAGTPAYLAPELLDGSGPSIQSDIYSMGVLLFRLVTGVNPVSGENLLDLRLRHQHGERRRLRDLRPDLPVRFVAVVERALAPLPEQRFKTAGDMEAAMLEALDHRLASTPVANEAQPAAARTRILRVLIAASLLIAVGASSGDRIVSRAAATGPPPFRAIAVLPLREASAGNTRDVADGLTDALIGELSRMRSVRVVSRSSSSLFKDTSKSVKEIGRELDVDGVVEGSVRRQGNSVAVTLRLVEAAMDRTAWSGDFEMPYTAINWLEYQMAAAIAYELKARLPQTPRLPRQIDPESHFALLRGRAQLAHRTPQALQAARKTFEGVVESNPDSASAYAALADAYTLLGMFEVLPKNETLPRAEAAATKAVELDPALADGHVSLAYVRADRLDRFGAKKELREAIDLNPNHAGAHHWYALLLVSDGLFEQAISEIEQAAALDPLSMIIGSDAGVVYMRAGLIDRAVAQLESVTRVHPEFGEGHMQLALAYEAQHRLDDCYRELSRAYQLSPNSPIVLEHLTWAAAVTGHRREAETLLGRLNVLNRGEATNPTSMAAIYVALGDNGRAFQYLEPLATGAKSDNSSFAVMPEAYPRLVALTQDARFAEFRRRVKAVKQPEQWPVQPAQPAPTRQ